VKVLVTMAGKGSRFRDVGVTVPKHEISVRDKPMFDWALRSLSDFFDEDFIFVTQSEHAATEFLSKACDRLGIDSYREVVLDNYTNGQATTATAASDLIAPHDSVVIYNIDTYIEQGELSPREITGDGYIPVFETSGERWSFIREDEEGHAIEVSEKEKISDNATAGFYYFDQWSYLKDAYEARAERVADKYGETYVAPLYNHLIRTGKTVVTKHIDGDAVHVLGTPTDLYEFDPEFDSSAW
jgi:dTDP-glucose pyrophosphorylase